MASIIKRICGCSSRAIYSCRKLSIPKTVNQRFLSTSRIYLYSDSATASKSDTPISEEEKGSNNTKSDSDEFAVNELMAKMKLLQKESNSYKDKYQRALADRENLRKRLEKQVIDAKEFGIQTFCKDLLEVSDIFRKAIESVPKDKVEEESQLFQDLYDGVIMTESQLLTVFRRHGLNKILPKEGDKFDPAVQEAMFEVPPEDGKSPGTIVHVLRTGWNLKERCVRSAQVSVVKS